jgi:hypothetical protein
MGFINLFLNLIAIFLHSSQLIADGNLFYETVAMGWEQLF